MSLISRCELELSCVAVSACIILFEHLAEIAVFAASGFEIEDQILDRQSQIVQRLLQVGHRFTEVVMSLLRLLSKLRDDWSPEGAYGRPWNSAWRSTQGKE